MTKFVKGRVSVVLTVHNDREYVHDSIKSILQQTHRDLELIVVDDGSTDGSAESVTSISDDRIKLLTPGRIGRGKALNAGIAASTGEFIAIQDSDDLSHPQRLEIEARFLKELNLDLLGASAILFEDNRVPVWSSIDRAADSPIDVTGELTMANPLPHITMMMRRSLMEALKGYSETRQSFFDYELLIRAAANGYRLYRIPISLAAKRIHLHQYFEKGARARYALEMLKLQCTAISTLKKKRWMLPMFPLIFCYRMMPRSFRMTIQRRRSLYNAPLV